MALRLFLDIPGLIGRGGLDLFHFRPHLLGHAVDDFLIESACGELIVVVNVDDVSAWHHVRIQFMYLSNQAIMRSGF